MSFNEKLQMLRKKNNLSQEELANMLDVTRQSVSKWESGITYPEMDKLLSLCKIFKCSLEELTNDDIKEIGLANKKKLNFDNFIDNTLELINKTYQMFRAMSFKDTIKCILVMGLIFILLLLLKVPFMLIQNSITNVVSNFSNTFVVNTIKDLFDLVLELIYLVIFIFLFIYLFKIIYLDKTVIKKTSNIKEEIPDEKVVIYSNNSNVFFTILGKIIIYFIKFMVICCALPVLVFFFFLCTGLLINFLLILRGIFYSSITLGLIFSILLCLVIIEMVLYFIFNRQLAFKRLGLSFIISIAGLGLSFGLLMVDISNTSYVNKAPDNIKESTIVKEINASSNLSYLNHYNTNYIVDESLSDTFKVEVKYYSDFSKIEFQDNDSLFINSINKNNVKKLKEIILKDLSKKTLHNYDKLYSYNITIYGSSKNIEELKNRMIESSNMEKEYQNTIASYEDTITELENKNDNLEEENQALKDKIEEYKDKINEYKNSLKDIIKE